MGATLFLACTKDKKITPNLPSLSTLSTTAVSSIEATTAIGGGEITNDGGSAVTERGICYSINVNPSTKDIKVPSNASGTGTFTVNLANLIASTTYYARAYAINSGGTAYGNEVQFTTVTPLVIGQDYQGGKIAYIDGTGKHGLIAAAQDQSTSTTWYIADDKCDNYSIIVNGVVYADWRLPNPVELNYLYTNRVAIGGFDSNTSYWGTDNNGTEANAITFISGNSFSTAYANLFAGRAVRSF